MRGRVGGWVLEISCCTHTAFHPPPNLPLEGGRDEFGEGEVNWGEEEMSFGKREGVGFGVVLRQVRV